MRYKKVLFLFFLIQSLFSYSQEIPIGQWRDHLSYRSAIAVAKGNNKVYCATEGALFSYNISDNSTERINKINGLSDVKINNIGFNNYNNTLLIAYQNANVDLLSNSSVYNLADIKREPDLGNKMINDVFFLNQYAYLACGFGIVLIDTEKKEVKDTYKFGTNGANINVYDVSSDGTTLYAATENGVYTASLNNPNLNYYGSWTKLTTIPAGLYNNLEFFQNKIFAAYVTPGNTSQSDTVYEFDGSAWTVFFVDGNLKKIKVFDNYMTLTLQYAVRCYDQNLIAIKQINGAYGFTYNSFRDAIVDSNQLFWIADAEKGLVKAVVDYNTESIFPNGPYTNDAPFMQSEKDKIWVTAGNFNDAWGNIYSPGRAYYFSSEKGWNTIKGYQNPLAMNLDSAHDFVSVAIDADNTDHAYISSYRKGIFEMKNGEAVKLYDLSNSSLAPTPGNNGTYAPALTLDKDKNLWASNTSLSDLLSVRKADGNWKAFNFSFINLGSSPHPGKVMVTQSGQKWMILHGGGIIVYNDDGSFPAANTANTKKLTNEAGKGGLPSSEVYCMAEDQDNTIWVGTDKGVAVFYSPDAIFNSNSGWDAQQILIEQDGHTQILLETQLVTAITVDGANRKWVATQSSGVFLFSPDGKKELAHFTTENSPLFSNEILSMTINAESGEIFFGTTNGIISYKSDATGGSDEFEQVYSYPNPVKENYEGPIAIKGLVRNVDVKITDITGTLVYQTKALGGQAIWYGKNFKGEKVHTGVYLVFCSNEDGSKTYVTKILFIN